LKSGTSIGANVEEAHGGISKSDFSSKISIAYKEAKESMYWLRLIYATDYLDEKLYKSLLDDCEELCRILFSILKVTRISKKQNINL
jgi:four helix bundle protein